MNEVPLLGLAAFSGTGKTTLLTRLIPLLKAGGLKVGLIKHAHHAFDIDHPGKDSYELRRAGATPVMVVSRRRRAIVYEYPDEGEVDLFSQLAYLDTTGLDLILVEGFKRAPIPKIELHRPALGKPLLFPEDPHVIAVASDAPLSCPCPLPQLDLNQPLQIAAFIRHDFLR
ncbi:molybdopterin-guanine dinucleotide biosynthesis adapter protein [Methylomarinovum caldicuralii]|uniref:Molybdopterin-guanine dinucleotide biosynthesis adapter protein n=1 Tax=Methylomarinovum caldicuralii TaxID=438856 RepID=A0AAU9C5W5_9GAMM|nr:molybdopterin-guanine dinucleotide biosynthesis protein B [Methylomarinovum caldicuralii]BCX82650.1 molybdopterin-guanine dinucleotide biosynthesis adapter protein [Methylomarinovum caldicuralii]